MADTTTEKTAAAKVDPAEVKADAKPAAAAEKPQTKPAEATADAKPAEAEADAKPAEATGVPEGHRRVMWVYCAADTSKNGHVEDVSADEARSLVEGNRAKYVDDETPLGKAERKLKPERGSAAAAK